MLEQRDATLTAFTGGDGDFCPPPSVPEESTGEEKGQESLKLG